jgi:EAL domain-containing protein (putative c-di-GMP-specific phosphodiesterase class I)
LRVPTFADDVRAALLKHGLAPERLTLEITETALVDEIEAASHVLAELRASGIRVAIDDFGTGYCSLSYLQRFPVDIVKIDRQFIEELSDDQRTTSLATMILQMTASLGVVSVAEGIERPEQMAALKQMGCDIGQGYLLSSTLDSEMICECLDNSVQPVARPIAAVTDTWSAPSSTVRSLSA